MKQINVTKTDLPELKEYISYLKGVWEKGWITNNGKLVVNLEKKLGNFLGLKEVILVTNGTIAIQMAIKALNIQGDIITTPFSYIASSSSLIWENCKPVYVDIDPKTWCIDVNKIEAAITPNTKAILAVHVFGNPCEVETIEKIAKKHNLKVIYDAAHAFGVKYKDKSLLSYGDASTLSFHATKLFHTVEGGAVIAKQKTVSKVLAHMRHFGHKTLTEFYGLGINGKISEFHAAMGLSLLPKVKGFIKKRKACFELYNKLLQKVDVQRQEIAEGTVYNYSYYPVLFRTERILVKVVKALNKGKIFPRRYFYPSLNEVTYIKEFSGKQSCPVSEDIARRILCLPLYAQLSPATIKKIVKIIEVTLKNEKI